MGGTSVPSGNETTNGLMKENGSEILFEFLRSTGDLMAMMLVGDMGEEFGDAGAEDTRLIVLVWGNTVMPHLLTGRTGAGVNKAGVTGEGGGGGRTATSGDSR